MIIPSFSLKFGSSPGSPSEKVNATPVTVFVGPNNSGKSRVLFEIERQCNTGYLHTSDIILQSLWFSGLPTDKAEQAVDQITKTPKPNEALATGHIIVGNQKRRVQIKRNDLIELIQSPGKDPRHFCMAWLGLNTLMLDGKSRINLTNQQKADDLQASPQSSFQVLFRDDVKRSSVRRIVEEAFRAYFVIDPTNVGNLRIRLSAKAPINTFEERGLHDEAIHFHSSAQLIDYTSDGIKAFIGIIIELIAGDPHVFLIDEPEAFLHPSLTFKLGYEISRAAITSQKNVFVSTHSPAFVMGCVQSGVPVNIVRLTYRNRVATARVLSSTELLRLMRNPLLRSTNIINGLFYDFVIVLESDADRAFYQEVNERLLRFKQVWGIPNCLFINAQNKQTIPTIVDPLRKLGIPTAGIVDIDVLKDGGSVWAKFLGCANIPTISHSSFAVMRNELKKAFDVTGRDMKRDGGIKILSASDQEAAQNLFDILGEYGMFVVPGGELESWLKELGATGHGPAWLIDAFERMGEDPSTPNYVKPTAGDVWKFLSEIKKWLTNQDRRGIPR